MELASTMNIINIALLLLDKISFLLLSLFFGNIAFKGWKGTKNIIFTWIMKIFLGIICFFGGLILNDYFKLNFIFSTYIFSLIVGIILFILLALISTAFKESNKFAKTKDINIFFTEFDRLRTQFQKLTQALKEKNLVSEDLMNEIIPKSSKKGFSKVKKFSNMYKNPFFIIGTLLTIGFFLFLILNISPLTKLTFKETFDMSFLNVIQMPEGCENTNILLENYKLNKITEGIKINNSLIISGLNKNDYYLQDKTGVMNYNNQTFFISTSYYKIENDLAKELLDNYENIYNIKICSFNENYELCNCIGKGKTDPIFTIPFLVEQGVIEEAMSNILKDSIKNMMGNFSFFN